MSAFPYATAEAFAAALADRFRAAHDGGRYSVNELRRQFAYDRLLARVFQDADVAVSWILKGGGGLLARIPEHARHSMDLDLFFEGEFADAIKSLQDVGHHDLGDFFDFDITEMRGIGTHGVRRLRVESFIGNKAFEHFRIDLVIASNMTQPPDLVGPLVPIQVPGLATSVYRVYSLVDHVADKHAAMIAKYNDGAASTRYRDLLDLVIIANTQPLDAAALRRALLSEYSARDLSAPATVELPNEGWVDGYANEVASLPAVPQRTAMQALDTVRSLLETVLNDDALTGTWDPYLRRWTT